MKTLRTIFSGVPSITILLSCFAQQQETVYGIFSPVSHKLWDTLSKKNASFSGNVDCNFLKQSKFEIEVYPNIIKNTHQLGR